MGLSHSPAQIIAQLLVDLGVASAASLWSDGAGDAWPAFHSSEPANPDNCITVYDTQGISNGRSMIDGKLFLNHGLQARVRATTHSLGWLKATAIQSAISEQTYQEIVHIEDSVYAVHCLARIGQVLSLGREAPTSSRRLFTLNFVAVMKQL